MRRRDYPLRAHAGESHREEHRRRTRQKRPHPSATGVTTEDGRNELAYKSDVLEAGQSRSGNFRLKASQPGRFPLRATAIADLNLSADAACETAVVQPALSVSKTGPATKYVGRPTSYQITVTNTGNTVARNTVVVDQVPPGMSAREASDNGQLGGGTVRWSLGDLAAGASHNLTVTMMPTQIGNVKNVVTAQAFCAEARAEYDTKIEGAPGILVEVIDDPDPIEVGGQTTYEIRVTNQGMIPITNVSATCTFPPELDFVSGNGPSSVTGQPKSATIAPFPVLNPKQVITYRVIAKGVKTGDARFEVQVISDLNTQVPIVEYESTHVYE